MHVHVLGDSLRRISEVAALLPSFCVVTTTLLREAMRVPTPSDAVVAAVDLKQNETVLALKEIYAYVSQAPKRLFLLEDPSRLSISQSYALGATSVLKMPASSSTILANLLDRAHAEQACSAETGLMVAAQAAEYVTSTFGAVSRGREVDIAGAMRIGSAIVDRVAEDGLATWLGMIREHHEGTFQHCLLVTGVTADFGLKLGLNSRDLERVVLAAVLHDVGKATIPASILDKPGRLDDQERAVIETHPVAGFDALKDNPAVAPEILDAVRHHHELLDGSGYPDKLVGTKISDLTRILTISDIFSALIENRGYKPAMPRTGAFEILQSMDGRLEMALVKAFKEVALHR